MLYGKPVIATNLGGNDELVRDGVTGYLIDELDFKQMAAKILNLLDNPAERESMGRKGTQVILENFTVDEMFRRYQDLYNKINNNK